MIKGNWVKVMSPHTRRCYDTGIILEVTETTVTVQRGQFVQEFVKDAGSVNYTWLAYRSDGRPDDFFLEADCVAGDEPSTDGNPRFTKRDVKYFEDIKKLAAKVVAGKVEDVDAPLRTICKRGNEDIRMARNDLHSAMTRLKNFAKAKEATK